METKTFELGYATVRIHEGKLTPEQRKVVLEDAAKDFFKAIQKQEAQSKPVH